MFLTDWYTEKDEYLNPELEEKWQNIAKLRKDINKNLEKARQGENKIIGNSLDAKVSLYSDNKDIVQGMTANRELLETVFIVSEVEIVNEVDETYVSGEEMPEIKIKVSHADGEKCERCWKYSTEIGKDSEYPTLCPRCASVLKNN